MDILTKRSSEKEVWKVSILFGKSLSMSSKLKAINIQAGYDTK